MKKIDLDELLRNVRPATPEELTAQAESYGKNYKPGPIQATPFMPTLPAPERTAEMVQLAAKLRDEAEWSVNYGGLVSVNHEMLTKLLDHVEGKPK